MKINYTNERNVQILISVLKHNNIKKVIASPGTTNMVFVASIQNDPFFEIISCVDERSACYMACGLAVESGTPVVLTCTGATASRNYLPGLTEAFYRKIPILAITCAQHFSKLGSYSPQCIDRTTQLKDIVNLSVQVPRVNNMEDEIGCNILINKAILELRHRGGGPVHINIETKYDYTVNFSVKNFPSTRFIDRIEYSDDIPKINKKKIGIFVGSHERWSEYLTSLVDSFCEKYNSFVICDHTSNYHGKYKILANIICDQEKFSFKLNNFDIIIHIGSVSGAYMKLNVNEVWRVNPDGEIRDTFSKLRYIFEMEEADFFKKYLGDFNFNKNISNYLRWQKELCEFQKIANKIELPFSNLWVSKKVIKFIPDKSCVHLAILNSLRSWNYFDTTKNIDCFSNTGGFGIDGPMSTLIGASFFNPKKIYFGVIGDLAFFYDLNSLGNKNINNNLRILLINNGCGTEFHNYSHPASILGDMSKEFIAADGHFGNKSIKLVKNFVESLDFEYICAKTKEEFDSHIEYFCSNEEKNKSIVFEVFTNSKEESDALKQIRNLKASVDGEIKMALKKAVSPKLKNKIKNIIKNR